MASKVYKHLLLFLRLELAPVLFQLVLNIKSKNPGIVSIQKICDGLEISVRAFFDCPLFDALEQEIK